MNIPIWAMINSKVIFEYLLVRFMMVRFLFHLYIYFNLWYTTLHSLPIFFSTDIANSWCKIGYAKISQCFPFPNDSKVWKYFLFDFTVNTHFYSFFVSIIYGGRNTEIEAGAEKAITVRIFYWIWHRHSDIEIFHETENLIFVSFISFILSAPLKNLYFISSR